MTIKTWNDRLPKTKEVTAHDRRWAMEAEIDELRAKLDQALEDALNFEARAYKAEAKLAELEHDLENAMEWKGAFVTLKERLAEIEKQEPIAYLAWRDGKPCWDGDDCVCQDAVYPVDFDDDRTSMPVYLKGTTNV